MSNYKRITELEFGQEMLLHDSKGTYPLEVVTTISAEDDNGRFYVPAIADYVTGDLMITGNSNGYTNRKELLACVGQCWDLAESN